MAVYSITEITNKDKVRVILSTDINYAAYALGDLEPPYSNYSRWYAAVANDEVEGLALHYSALHPHVLFLFGTVSAINALLMQPIGPNSVFFTVKPDALPTLETFYELQQASHMFRMRLEKVGFMPIRFIGSNPTRLNINDAETVEKLIRDTSSIDGRDIRDVAFSTDMLGAGHYFGQFVNGRLVAVAGTHVVAPTGGMAAVGNVVVHPEFRKRGFGAVVSSAVTSSLVDAGFELIVLNVRQNNAPALRIYEKLGYKQACTFVEGVAIRR